MSAPIPIPTPERKRWSEYDEEQRSFVIRSLRQARANVLREVMENEIVRAVADDVDRATAEAVALYTSALAENIIDAALERLGERVE